MEENNTQQKTTTLLIWLDANIDEVKNKESTDTISQLREVISNVHTFTNLDECIDFISDIHEEKAFMISSGAFGPTAVPVIQEMPQVSAIYIFCGNKLHHEQWSKQYPIVKGVFVDIKQLCETLKIAVQECNSENILVSFASTSDETTNKNLDQLPPSFMYSLVLKEILLSIDFEEKQIKKFLTYCRQKFIDNDHQLKNVDKLEKEYRQHTPIWWYTSNYFLDSMINRALCNMDIDIIIKMGFFIRDLHNQIAQLHTEQYSGHHQSKSFTVYRGQGLPQTDFDQLRKTKGGLISFNNFLSTNQDRAVSLMYAESDLSNPDFIGVLFQMTVDPSISSTPYANISNLNYFAQEEEILFSMHAVFRIGEMKPIDENNRLWQVDLILTNDQDKDLQNLTQLLREETFPGESGWYRLSELLIKMGQFDMAQKVLNILLDQATDDGEKVYIYQRLGMIKTDQGEYAEALPFYEKSVEISQKILPPDHPDLAHSYNNIAVVYDKMGDYSKALSYHEKALQLRQKTLPTDHPDLAISYTNVGMVYNNMSEHSKALASHEKAIEIREKTLPPNHPDLAVSFNNIASVYYQMNDYAKALSFYQRALDIAQHSLPADHSHTQLYKMNVELVKAKL